MNNLYHWHDERMVELKMQEINREIEKIRLLREAGLSNPSWTARAVEAFHNLFIPRDKGVQDQRCIERQSYQSTDEKSAQ